MKVVMVKSFFDTEANYQINEMVKAWPSGNELVIITSKHLDYVHKVYDEIQVEKDKAFASKYGIKLIRLDTHFKFGMRVFFKSLKRTVEIENPDVLFMHGFGDFNDVLFLYGRNKYLTFRDCHMSWVASKNRFASLYYLFFKLFFAPVINVFNKYEKVYALGIEEKEYLQRLGVKNHKIAMLPHGYNSLTYYVSGKIRETTRNLLFVDKNDKLISYIGKFNFQKSPHIALAVYRKLSKSFVSENNLRFLFLGGKDTNYMENVFYPELEKFEYKDRVILHDAVNADDLVGYYNASDICFWPKETTLSSIHAQVCGCSIIMESHTSNLERVIDSRFIYDKSDLNGALKSVQNAVLSDESNFDISSIIHREYNIQMKRLLSDWEKLINENID